MSELQEFVAIVAGRSFRWRDAMRPPSWTNEMRVAFSQLLAMTDVERGEVMSLFCRGCDRYVGRCDRCHCENDE